MSDFDAALERLMVDPAFKAALARDPASALAGYRLAPDELEILCAQVDTGTGGERQVEDRTSKASMFGLVAPIGDGIGSGLGDLIRGGGSAGGMAPGGGTGAASFTGDSFSGSSTAGGTTDGGTSFGGTPQFSGSSTAGGTHGFGETPTFGTADADAPATSGRAPVDNYSTRVDADGDGRWDRHTVVSRADGGVDIVVDRDGDGRAEFVGHDLDRDGLIDEASTDSDRDGRLDTRWVDDDGDGWLDRRVRYDEGPGPRPAER